VVVPDGGSDGEDALRDADSDALEGPAAVSFQVELSLKRVIDRLIRRLGPAARAGARPTFLEEPMNLHGTTMTSSSLQF
jgi:hypothetical protein